MPYTGVVLTFVAIHAAAFLILLGYWVAAAGMFPQATNSFAEIYSADDFAFVQVDDAEKASVRSGLSDPGVAIDGNESLLAIQ